MPVDIGAQLVSKLGSPDSKIPLAVKDAFNTGGYTYFSYNAGGSIECKDRFVDEVGTFAIWMGGIPAYKWLVDHTLFKKANISSAVDVRVAENADYLKQAIKHAPSEQIKKELLNAGSNLSKVKSLNIAKFGIAMVMTMLSYLGLTKLKQHMTKKNIEKEFDRQRNTSSINNGTNIKYNNQNVYVSSVFDEFNSINKRSFNNDGQKKSAQKSAHNPSFGSLKIVEEFMLNPVKNMILLDVGISSERLIHSRTDGERKEYAIKEGSFLFFTYLADRLIKKGLDFCSKTFLNLPISLDAKFLSSDLSKNILNNKELQNQIKLFNLAFTKDTEDKELYKFIFENQDNIVVESAKKSGIIETIEDNEGKLKIDTRKYIDTDKIKNLAKDLQIYIEKSEKFSDIDKYINNVRKLKVISTGVMIGICCLFLGYFVPKFMYQYRQKQQDGNDNFHVRAKYEKELAERAGMKC